MPPAKLPTKQALGEGAPNAAFSPSRINLLDLRVIGDAGDHMEKGLNALGHGLGRAIVGADAAMKKQEGENDAIELATANADFAVRESELRSKLSQDPDYASAPQRYREGMEQIHSETAAKITNPKNRELYFQRQRPHVESGYRGMEDYSRRRDGEVRVTEADQRLDALGEQALRVTTPEERNRAITAGNEMIDGLVASRHLTPAQGAAKKKQWVTRYATSAFEALPPSQQLEEYRKFDEAQKGAQQPAAPAAPAAPAGQLEPGNIDMSKRPEVKQPDGKTATVMSKSFGIDGKEVLLPTVSDDGKMLSDDEAIEQYKKTGKHLGIFDTAENATKAGQAISAAEGQRIGADDGGEEYFPNRYSDEEQPAAVPAAAKPAARDYGPDMPGYFGKPIPIMYRGAVEARIRQAGVWDELPPALRKKIQDGTGFTKKDIDALPDKVWAKIAPEVGAPVPKLQPAAATPAAAPDPTSRGVGTVSFNPATNSAIDNAAKEAGVPPDLMRRIARIESGGRANAVTGSYKGLFQLSESEFRKYGGGNIFNPEDNARAAARKTAAEIESFRQRYGREPTPTEIYLQHQQGIAGAAAHLSNPDRPAWQSMHSTGEGRSKGERWSKLAIWGNIPDQDKRRFGRVENVTSRDFVELWRSKVERGGGGPAPGGGPNEQPQQASVQVAEASVRSGTLLDFIPADKREILRRKAEQGQWQHNASEKVAVQQGVDSDLLSLRNTGEGTTMDPDRVAKALGPDKAAQYMEKREVNRRVYVAEQGLVMLSDADIESRVASLRPQPGDPEYKRKVEVMTEVRKTADAIKKVREDDPALAAMEIPMVRQAVEQMDPRVPESVTRAQQALLGAQEAMGIPEDRRTVITNAQAAQIAAPLEKMLPGQERRTLRELGAAIVERYPDPKIATRVWEQVIQGYVKKEETGRVAGRILQDISAGTMPTTQQLRDLRVAQDVDAAKAVTGEKSGIIDSIRKGWATVMGGSQAAAGSGKAASEPPKPTGSPPPARAIQELRSNPKLAPAFDKEYGKGWADHVLKTFKGPS